MQIGSATLVPELRGRWDVTLTYVPPNFISQFGTVSGNDGSLGAAFFFHPDGRPAAFVTRLNRLVARGFGAG